MTKRENKNERSRVWSGFALPEGIASLPDIDTLMESTDGIFHHPLSACDGDRCPFHKPSDHPMVDWPMQLRESTLIERVCPHGVGHPDPDSVWWINEVTHQDYGVHGCDGCCRRRLESPEEIIASLIEDV